LSFKYWAICHVRQQSYLALAHFHAFCLSGLCLWSRSYFVRTRFHCLQKAKRIRLRIHSPVSLSKDFTPAILKQSAQPQMYRFSFSIRPSMPQPLLLAAMRLLLVFIFAAGIRPEFLPFPRSRPVLSLPALRSNLPSMKGAMLAGYLSAAPTLL
jgi:hypothetical protein